MKFLVSRASQGVISTDPPCRGAIRGSESPAWPGEYQWVVELNSLEDLVRFLNDNGGSLGVYAPEEGEDFPMIEIFDDTEEDE